MEIQLNNDNQIHVKNMTGQNLYILVSPNTDWLLTDLAVSVKSTFSGRGLLEILKGKPTQIKNINDLYNLYKMAKDVKTAIGLNVAKKIYKTVNNEHLQKTLPALKI